MYIWTCLQTESIYSCTMFHAPKIWFPTNFHLKKKERRKTNFHMNAWKTNDLDGLLSEGVTETLSLFRGDINRKKRLLSVIAWFTFDRDLLRAQALQKQALRKPSKSKLSKIRLAKSSSIANFSKANSSKTNSRKAGPPKALRKLSKNKSKLAFALLMQAVFYWKLHKSLSKLSISQQCYVRLATK